MNVGLIQADGKFPNLALMKLSAFHKKLGDDVRLIDISDLKFDRVYASKVFAGGSGIDLKSVLPDERHIFCYILIGFDTDFEYDKYRARKMLELGIRPFIMIYNNRKDDPKLRHLSRYYNQRFYDFVKIEDYKNGVLAEKKDDEK